MKRLQIGSIAIQKGTNRSTKARPLRVLFIHRGRSSALTRQPITRLVQASGLKARGQSVIVSLDGSLLNLFEEGNPVTQNITLAMTHLKQALAGVMRLFFMEKQLVRII